MPVYCILPWQRERGNLAHVSSCCCSNLCDPTPWTTALQASLSFISFWMLLKFMSVESMMPSNHLILCHPLLLPLIFPSNRIFSQWVDSSHQVAKYWSFGFSISPSNEYSGLISFRFDWFDLLAVWRALKNLLHLHNYEGISSLVLILLVQISHLYMTTGKLWLWLYRPLLAKWCLCFLICCLGLL